MKCDYCKREIPYATVILEYKLKGTKVRLCSICADNRPKLKPRNRAMEINYSRKVK